MRKSGTGHLMGGWEWCCDADGVVAAVLMMNLPVLYCHCNDNNNPGDVGWCCQTRNSWGAQIATKSARHIVTDHPGKNVTRGNRLSGTSAED